MSLSVCLCVCVCVCVCLCVPVCMSKITGPTFTNDHVSVLLWRSCDILCTSGFMNDVMFAHNCQEYIGDAKKRILEVTQHWGQHGLDAAAHTQ